MPFSIAKRVWLCIRARSRNTGFSIRARSLAAARTRRSAFRSSDRRAMRGFFTVSQLHGLHFPRCHLPPIFSKAARGRVRRQTVQVFIACLRWHGCVARDRLLLFGG